MYIPNPDNNNRITSRIIANIETKPIAKLIKIFFTLSSALASNVFGEKRFVRTTIINM